MKVPSFVLSDIEFEIKINGVPDSLKEYEVKIINSSGNKATQNLVVINGAASWKLKIETWGTYIILDMNGKETFIRVMPGWFSILPPLIAIVLSLVLREVMVSLLAGIWIGAIFIYNYNPFTALLRLADTIMINTLINSDHMFIILFTLLFGGVIGVIQKNGGTIGLSNLVTKYARNARMGMISSSLMGILIFFDDYANSLIIGNMMRPITDKLKISREKLAYIVDSTAAPVASVFIISSWIGFEIGLIDAGLKVINSTENAYEVLLSTIPYRFYPIAALFFVFLTSFMRRDFGPMYRAEIRARKKGQVSNPGSMIEELTEDESLIYKGDKARWINGFVPIMVILFGTIAGLILTGMNSLNEQGITDYSARQIISNSNSFSSLLWAGFAACLVAIIMSSWQKIISLTNAISAWTKGLQSMLFACIILVFAWAISDVTNQLGTADYIISLVSETLNPRFLPVIVFVICALISFATGTSWGTMAIIMPIVIPLGFKMAQIADYSYSDSILILHGVISSVLAGSVFGDHCSPIADTTILSSMASRCNHIDHVKTQLPYAVVVGIICMLLGDILTSYGLNPFIALGLIFASLFIFLKIFGRDVPDAFV
ncbi:MAG: Na+/H+ antiporter NhaC family protein [Bacteroidetes bacterium]|nr:Na+/H+ antiporter NhaC family protein [Bacteroidota bacterium]